MLNHASRAVASAAARSRSWAPPREARDTWFLLVVIAWVVAPQLPRLPVWCGPLVAGVLAWRGWLAWTGRHLPATRWRLGLLAVALGATLASHHTLVGRDAGITLIAVLLALKTLELRARRDAFVVFFLGLFTLLTQFFASQTPATAAFVGVGVLGLFTALVNAHRPAGTPTLTGSAWIAARLLLLGLPLAVVLFVLFPRLPPLWGLGGDALAGRSGLSAQMEVGDVARLALDDSVAMELVFDGPVPPRSQLYFRGPVLANFDGRTWHPLYPHRVTLPLPEVAARRAPARTAGEAVRYTLTQPPSHRPWLPLLDITLEPPQTVADGTDSSWRRDLRRTPEAQWVLAAPAHDVVRLRAESHPLHLMGPIDRLGALPLEYRELPASYNPRTLQLATDLMKASPAPPDDKATLVRMALQRLREGGYRYTLEPGTFGRDSADEFWFDRREGFCEHIASAFAILMRGMDIPARIVTGYQGGEAGAGGGAWRVRQSDAHAWVEVWLHGQGWVRVDPTQAVAPSRTGSLQRLAPRPGLLGSAVSALDAGLAERWRAAWASVEALWRDGVTDYTPSRQQALLHPLLGSPATPGDLLRIMGLALAGLAAAGLLAIPARTAWRAWRIHRGDDPLRRRLETTRKRLTARGLQLPPSATPRQMARAVHERFGAQAGPLAEWLAQAEAARYGKCHARPRSDLAREWRQLPWPR